MIVSSNRTSVRRIWIDQPIESVSELVPSVAILTLSRLSGSDSGEPSRLVMKLRARQCTVSDQSVSRGRARTAAHFILHRIPVSKNASQV